MYYTYILESISDSSKHYIGSTSDLKTRLTDHNQSKVSSTKKFKPWKIKMYFAFENNKQALHFEKYLKSGSGHAFANRHFYSI